ncbi:MAG TPA: acyltransferase [Usitatibacter sp.]|nr:acyltransferase [Usitatibacter sp.]
MSAAALASASRTEGVRAEFGAIGAIEGLRGIAVAWVVLFHYFIVRTGRAADPWNDFVASHRALEVVVRNGYLGVDLFFLITGFLLVLPWERQRCLGLAAPDAKAFYVRRIRRIAPAYYVQLAVLFAVFVPLLWSIDSWRQDTGYLATNLIAHAAFLHYTTPVTSSSMGINGALWTLALEVQYYALLPLFAAAFVRAPLRWALGFAAVAALWHVGAQRGLAPLVAFEMRMGAVWDVPEDAARHLLESQLPGYLAHFALGILLALAWMQARVASVTNGVRAASAVLAAASLALLAGIHGGWMPSFPASNWLSTITLVAGVLQFPLVAAPAIGTRVLGRPALRALGRVSYSVYLYHLPLIYFWTKARVLEERAVSMPLCLAAIAAVAVASYYCVERPFLRGRAPAATLVTAAA